MLVIAFVVGVTTSGSVLTSPNKPTKSLTPFSTRIFGSKSLHVEIFSIVCAAGTRNNLLELCNKYRTFSSTPMSKSCARHGSSNSNQASARMQRTWIDGEIESVGSGAAEGDVCCVKLNNGGNPAKDKKSVRVGGCDKSKESAQVACNWRRSDGDFKRGMSAVWMVA